MCSSRPTRVVHVTFDNLSTSDRWTVRRGPLIEGATPSGRSTPTVGASIAERLITEYAHALDLGADGLRHFIAIGADAQGETGENDEPETQLIPNIIRAALNPATKSTVIFGDDYNTPDSTYIRDYAHVEGLCTAHCCDAAP